MTEEIQTNVDIVSPDGQSADGAIATQMLQGGVNPTHLRPYLNEKGQPRVAAFTGGNKADPKNYKARPVGNATLRRDEWKALDEAVLRIAEERLRGVQDLKSAGLTFNLNDAMGSTVLEYHDVGDALSAATTMDGVTRGENDRPTYQTNYLPLPIVHADYQINQRVLAASRRMGNPLDTTLAERASRKVNETLEDMLFTDTTYAYGGGTIYSYINHPNRNTTGFSNGTWDSANVSDIIQDVRDMKQSSIDANHFGPWMIYVPTNYETVLDQDYDNTRGNTVRERIEAINGIREVKVVDRLPNDNVVLVEMTSDVVRWVNGMNIQNVEWTNEGGMVNHFKVMTIQVPQVRADQLGQSGVVHLS